MTMKSKRKKKEMKRKRTQRRKMKTNITNKQSQAPLVRKDLKNSTWKKKPQVKEEKKRRVKNVRRKKK